MEIGEIRSSHNDIYELESRSSFKNDDKKAYRKIFLFLY